MNTNGFIKLPNSICSLQGLSCRAYLYITYLCTIQQSDTVKVKQKTIRQNIGASTLAVVNKTMHKLQDLKLISITNNKDPETNFYVGSSYKVNDFNPQKDYFLLSADYAVIDMPPMAYQLMLTLYMLSFNDSYSFPSYTEIISITGMSSASISKSIGILEDKGIIRKENYIKKDGSKGHNRYFLTKKIQRIMKTEKAEKLLQWIRKQREVCFEVWQIIKEVIRGNVPLLDEICSLTDSSDDNSTSGDRKAQTEKSGEAWQDGELYSVPGGLIACCSLEDNYTSVLPCAKNHSFFGRLKDKISCIGRKTKESFGSLFFNLMRHFSEMIKYYILN